MAPVQRRAGRKLINCSAVLYGRSMQAAQVSLPSDSTTCRQHWSGCRASTYRVLHEVVHGPHSATAPGVVSEEDECNRRCSTSCGQQLPPVCIAGQVLDDVAHPAVHMGACGAVPQHIYQQRQRLLINHVLHLGVAVFAPSIGPQLISSSVAHTLRLV